MIVLYMKYVVSAAITACGHVIVIYIPLGWLFFLKRYDFPIHPCINVSAKPSLLYKEVECIYKRNLIKMSLTLFVML